MSRRAPYLFEVVCRDGLAERIVLYASTRGEAQKNAEAWARRLGVEVEIVKADKDA